MFLTHGSILRVWTLSKKAGKAERTKTKRRQSKRARKDRTSERRKREREREREERAMEINLRRTSGGEADTEFLFLISSSIVDVLVFWAFLSHRIERERE